MAVMLLRHARSQLILIGQDLSRDRERTQEICFTHNKTVNHHKKKEDNVSKFIAGEREEQEVHRL